MIKDSNYNFPSTCYDCKRSIRGESSVVPILLVCECMIAFCEDCAHKSLLTCKVDSTEMAFLQVACPLCKKISFSTNLSPNKIQVNNARLRKSIDINPELLHQNDHCLTEKTEFVHNQYLTRELNEVVDDKCVACREKYPGFQSVLLPCACLSVMCQYCARKALSLSEATFYDNIRCPTCNKSNIPIMGIREAAAYENKLVMDALYRFQLTQSTLVGLMKLKPYSLQNLLQICCFQFVVDCGFALTNDDEQNICKQRLQVAMLELQKQRGRVPNLGVLKKLKFYRHVTYESFVTQQQSMNHSDCSQRNSNKDSESNYKKSQVQFGLNYDTDDETEDNFYDSINPLVAEDSDISLTSISSSISLYHVLVPGVGYLCPCCPNEFSILCQKNKDLKSHIRRYHPGILIPYDILNALGWRQCWSCYKFLTNLNETLCKSCKKRVSRTDTSTSLKENTITDKNVENNNEEKKTALMTSESILAHTVVGPFDFVIDNKNFRNYRLLDDYRIVSPKSKQPQSLLRLRHGTAIGKLRYATLPQNMGLLDELKPEIDVEFHFNKWYLSVGTNSRQFLNYSEQNYESNMSNLFTGVHLIVRSLNGQDTLYKLDSHHATYCEEVKDIDTLIKGFLILYKFCWSSSRITKDNQLYCSSTFDDALDHISNLASSSEMEKSHDNSFDKMREILERNCFVVFESLLRCFDPSCPLVTTLGGHLARAGAEDLVRSAFEFLNPTHTLSISQEQRNVDITDDDVDDEEVTMTNVDYQPNIPMFVKDSNSLLERMSGADPELSHEDINREILTQSILCESSENQDVTKGDVSMYSSIQSQNYSTFPPISCTDISENAGTIDSSKTAAETKTSSERIPKRKLSGSDLVLKLHADSLVDQIANSIEMKPSISKPELRHDLPTQLVHSNQETDITKKRRKIKAPILPLIPLEKYAQPKHTLPQQVNLNYTASMMKLVIEQPPSLSLSSFSLSELQSLKTEDVRSNLESGRLAIINNPIDSVCYPVTPESNNELITMDVNSKDISKKKGGKEFTFSDNNTFVEDNHAYSSINQFSEPLNTEVMKLDPSKPGLYQLSPKFINVSYDTKLNLSKTLGLESIGIRFETYQVAIRNFLQSSKRFLSSVKSIEIGMNKYPDLSELKALVKMFVMDLNNLQLTMSLYEEENDKDQENVNLNDDQLNGKDKISNFIHFEYCMTKDIYPRWCIIERLISSFTRMTSSNTEKLDTSSISSIAVISNSSNHKLNDNVSSIVTAKKMVLSKIAEHRRVFQDMNFKIHKEYAIFIHIPKILKDEKIFLAENPEAMRIQVRVYLKSETQFDRAADVMIPHPRVKIKSFRSILLQQLNIELPNNTQFLSMNEAHIGARIQESRTCAFYNIRSGTIILVRPGKFRLPVLNQNNNSINSQNLSVSEMNRREFIDRWKSNERRAHKHSINRFLYRQLKLPPWTENPNDSTEAHQRVGNKNVVGSTLSDKQKLGKLHQKRSRKSEIPSSSPNEENEENNNNEKIEENLKNSSHLPSSSSDDDWIDESKSENMSDSEDTSGDTSDDAEDGKSSDRFLNSSSYSKSIESIKNAFIKMAEKSCEAEYDSDSLDDSPIELQVIIDRNGDRSSIPLQQSNNISSKPSEKSSSSVTEGENNINPCSQNKTLQEDESNSQLISSKDPNHESITYAITKFPKYIIKGKTTDDDDDDNDNYG